MFGSTSPDRALQAQLAEIDEAAGTAQGLYSDNRRRLRELETKRERTINLCLEGYLSKADMQAMVNKFDKDITARQDDIARLENGAEYRAESDAAVKAARQFCEDLAPTLNRLTTEERQELLRALVDEVWINEEGQVTLVGPFTGGAADKPSVANPVTKRRKRESNR